MEEVVAQRELDDRAFKELEEAGSRKGARRRIALTEPLRARLRLSIRRYANLHAFKDTYSPEALDRWAAVAALPTAALRRLQLWDLRQIVYGEDSAMAMCVDGVASGDPKSDKLLASVPGAIEVAEALVRRASLACDAVDGRFTREHPRKAVHNEVLAREVAEIFRQAGGKPGFGSDGSEGPFGRFLRKLWEFLPIDARPKTESGLVDYCEVALKDEEQRKIERRVLDELRRGDKSEDDLRTSFDRKFKKAAVDRTLVALTQRGHITSSIENVGRRPVRIWSLQKTPEMIECEMKHGSVLDGAISAAMRGPLKT